MLLSKIFGGVTVDLLIVCGLLYWSHGRATEANASLLAEQMRIQRQTEAELRETATRLAQLRDEHEDIQKFLALPVPRSFVDHWMRGKT